MHKEGVSKFPYYVGVKSLTELATRDDRVCVLNILGTESRSVTPVSHAYSGNNIVFGTGPGRGGQTLETPDGPIPVYNSIREGVKAGHKFNTAVIYLPPAGVKDGVAEAVRHSPDLKKIVILTEKVSLSDARIIRAIAQANGIDVFGANCLGLADAWTKVRIGGALGGSKPDESLVKGSVALFSNSGNFTTTIAVYLLTGGWGTTTSISSGKDVYIHYGPKEFFPALDNDDRSRAAVVYAEPGGYYEADLKINKPTVACVVGRWKAQLTKACGHAGSLAGSGDDARAKEGWFMDYFGVDDIYTPENPVCSAKGAVVINIAHIPEALTAVMALNGAKPDFEPRGTLSLKCWFANDAGVDVPESLSPTVVRAVSPYGEQIEALEKQVGAQFPRERLKDASGASMMDPKTQVSKIHGISILDASKRTLEENLVMCLLKEYPSATEASLANIAFNAFVNHSGRSALAAAEASRKAGNSPNTVATSAVCITGSGGLCGATEISALLIRLFGPSGLKDAYGDFDSSAMLKELSAEDKELFSSCKDDTCATAIAGAVKDLGASSVFLDFVNEVSGGTPSSAALLSAIWTGIGWTALMKKRVTKTTIKNLPWYSRIFSTIVGCSVAEDKQTKDTFCGITTDELLREWSFTETAFMAIVGRRPEEKELFEFSTLLGLIITNGPGTISAQGSKGAVSADGPEDPTRVQINKAFAGFMTHTGFAHGGNGYEAIAFLMEMFKDTGLTDPSDKNHGIDLRAISDRYAEQYGEYKAEQKAVGNLQYNKIPCVNHPIFKGNDVNFDPRERFVSTLFEEKGIYNVFKEFYSGLVNSLYEKGVSKNVYCVNVDAIIAVILLKIVWADYQAGKIADADVETAAFTTFLFGRMIGCAAEIDDHINRGRNMDTRTAASKCSFVG